MHARDGNILKHMTQAHSKTPPMQDLADNTRILKQRNNHKKVHILGNVYISQYMTGKRRKGRDPIKRTEEMFLGS